MRNNIYEDERVNKRFNFFSNDKKDKPVYKITFISTEDENINRCVVELPADEYINRKNLKKGFSDEEKANIAEKIVEELQKQTESVDDENKKLREQIETLLKANEELNKKVEVLNIELQQKSEKGTNTENNQAEQLKDELQQKNEQLSESQQKIEFFENKVKEQEKRINEYINNRNLPQAITEDIDALNHKFAEAREMILSLKEKVNYGDSGLKKLCYLFSVCYSIGKDEIKSIAEQIKYILEDDFNCRMIKPNKNEVFDSHFHEATVYDAHCTVIDECLTPGWKYNEKVLVKAIVKIKQNNMGEKEDEC